jgi:hypothetical protein
MKLYKIRAVDPKETDDSKNETHWVGSQSDAAAKRKELVSSGFARKDIETFEVDYPTDKAGLLAHLNANS